VAYGPRKGAPTALAPGGRLELAERWDGERGERPKEFLPRISRMARMGINSGAASGDDDQGRKNCRLVCLQLWFFNAWAPNLMVIMKRHPLRGHK
jgi:hypothetical protein